MIIKNVSYFYRAVGFCFIFASFLMLLTTICFIIGAPLQKVCEGLENDGFYKHVSEHSRTLYRPLSFQDTIFNLKKLKIVNFMFISAPLISPVCLKMLVCILLAPNYSWLFYSNLVVHVTSSKCLSAVYSIVLVLWSPSL